MVSALVGAIACRPDYMDVNTSADTVLAESEMTLDVRVSGEFISTKSSATETEEALKDLDVFVFRSSAEGVVLEYVQMAVPADRSEDVPGSADKLVFSSKLVLPTSGAKRVVVVGNGSKAVYPDLEVGTTTYESFCGKFFFKASESRANAAPFVMVGQTAVANASGSRVLVRLGRQYNKLDIVNGAADRLSISRVQLVSAPSVAYPLGNIYESDEIPEFISYPEIQVASAAPDGEIVRNGLYVLFTPADSPENCLQIRFWGKKDGLDFQETVQCEQPMYPDYNTVMTVGLDAENRISAKYTPDYSSFQTEGAAMTYTLASWMWTGLMGNNDYAQAWLAGNPVVSPDGGTMAVVDVKNAEYAPQITYSTGTTGQLKNRLRAHSMYTGDCFLWTVPVAEAKKGGTLGMANGLVSATQWGPKYFLMEYSFDNVSWTPVKTPISEKTASGADRTVRYTIKLLKQDDPQPLDFSVPVTQSIKNGTLYVRLTVADPCCSKELNGDIDASKTAGITYIHVKNYDSADKDKVFDEDWSSIMFTYKEPEK